MTRFQSLSDDVRARINAAIERARTKPIPWEEIAPMAVADAGPTLTLEDRPPGFRPKSEFVELPGFRAAISFEYQPAGLLRHLSISAEPLVRGVLPDADHCVVIAHAFGIAMPDRVWLEEFEPGCWAANMVQIESATH